MAKDRFDWSLALVWSLCLLFCLGAWYGMFRLAGWLFG